MNSKICTKEEAVEIMRHDSATVITGSFDIMHLGHMRFIAKAKVADPSNVLFVIVLSDDAIRERKGQGRPFFKQAERAEFLTYLKDVDYVLPWPGKWQDLRKFLTEARPKLLVVNDSDEGIDNKREVMESIGGEVVVQKRVGNHSTSRIIEAIGDL